MRYGKTTLAKNISIKYQIPHFEKDNIVWKRIPNGEQMRTPEERDTLFKGVIDGYIINIFEYNN